MSTILYFKGVRVEVRARERNHRRPHAHAVGHGCAMSFDINTFEVMAVRGFDRTDVKEIVELAKEYREELRKAWRIYHG